MPGSIALFRADGTQLFNTLAPEGTGLAPALNPDLVRRVAETGRIETSNLFRSPFADRFMVTVVCPVPRTFPVSLVPESSQTSDRTWPLRA